MTINISKLVISNRANSHIALINKMSYGWKGTGVSWIFSNFLGIAEFFGACGGVVNLTKIGR